MSHAVGHPYFNPIEFDGECFPSPSCRAIVRPLPDDGGSPVTLLALPSFNFNFLLQLPLQFRRALDTLCLTPRGNLGSMKPEPASTPDPPNSQPDAFQVLVAWGNEQEGKWLADIVRGMLREAPHHITVAQTRKMADTLKVPELQEADFVLFRLNAWEVSKDPNAGTWMPAMEEFVADLRGIASGALFCSTYFWLPTTREGLLRAARCST